MSLISQTTSYTTPGSHTYIVPQGVGSLEFHLWGAGGAAGGAGPTTRVQSGTTTTSVQTGTEQVQTGTELVQTGTEQVLTGTDQKAIGTHQVAYQVSVAQPNNKTFGSAAGGPLASSSGIIGQANAGIINIGTSYTTVTQYRTVTDYINIPVYSTVPIMEYQPVFATQPTYTSISTPTYSTAIGGTSGIGGGGGYASRTIQVHLGDVIVISVGSAGANPTGGTSTNFNGGSGAVAVNGSAGGGGGAATVITVNGVVVAVAAGGGAGGGGGIVGQAGTDGTAATISGIGNGTQGNGSSSVSGPATGGAGGAGYYGGLAGTSGTRGTGGQGGVCYGAIIQGGSGPTPGGITLPQYPGHSVGYAANSGAAILIFNKSFNINVRRNGQWDVVNSAWVKVGGNWKELSNGWTKVSGVWKPLISPDAVIGAENLVTPTITYAVSADSASISEGDPVVFTLATTGISAGTIVPYTASGIDANDVTGSLTGNFVVGTTDTITFTPRLNNTTNGTRTLRVSINNTTATASCTVLDTSTTDSYSLVGNVSTVNEGGTVTFTLFTSAGPGEVIPYSVSGILATDLSSGSLTGNFVTGITYTASFTLVADTLTEGTETLTITLHGRPGSASCAVVDTSRSFTPFTGSVALSGSGVWTVPQYVTQATFTVAGGGGGGSDGGSKNHNEFGDGGKASQLASSTITVSAGQTYSYSIGAGGAGGPGQGAGKAGGTSTVTGVVTSGGGAGGASQIDHVFHPGQGSSNGGASGGNGSAAGYKNIPGSAGQSGFGTISWSGSRPD